MTGKSFSAVIPAAGLSSRMGAFKPLLPLGADTVIGTVLNSFREAGVADLVVVTGHERERLATAGLNGSATLVHNPAHEEGMFGSIQTGVRALPSGTGAFFLLPVDIPLVRPATIRRLRDRFLEATPPILYPTFGGQRGHPPLISALLIDKIVTANRTATLRDILAEHEELAVDVEVPDQNVLFDVDTLDAYLDLLARWERRGIPTDEECAVIWSSLGPGPATLNHCRNVALVALSIGQALSETQAGLDLELIKAAALLHDIARNHPDHALTGAGWLRELGFGLVGELVAAHSDLPVPTEPAITPAEVVFIADKMVQETGRTTLDQRYQDALGRYGRIPEVRQRIEARWERARAIQVRIEERLNFSLERLLQDALPDVAPESTPESQWP